jgi:hypothetical protein
LISREKRRAQGPGCDAAAFGITIQNHSSSTASAIASLVMLPRHS